MAKSNKVNHKLHFIISFLTVGLWLPFYLILVVSNREKKKIEEKGTVRIPKPPPQPRAINKKDLPLSPTNLGYKKPSFGSGERTCYLSCNHLIKTKSSGLFGLTGKGYEGKQVWCEVCSQEREVITTMLM